MERILHNRSFIAGVLLLWRPVVRKQYRFTIAFLPCARWFIADAMTWLSAGGAGPHGGGKRAEIKCTK